MTKYPSFALLLLLILLCASPSLGQDDADGGFGGAGGGFPGMGDQNCAPFRCSAGYAPVPKSRSRFVSRGGCGSMGGGMMMGGSFVEEEKPYEGCCHQWHACYQTCGASKKRCDDHYKKCAEDTCTELPAGEREDCSKGLEIGTVLLQFEGCQKFDAGQYEGCECVRKAKVEEKRAAAIRGFYKKWSPDNVDKADNLAKKTDSVGKMAALFGKLLGKYPEAIKIESDPEQTRMQRMMKEAKADKVDDSEEADEASDGDMTEEL